MNFNYIYIKINITYNKDLWLFYIANKINQILRMTCIMVKQITLGCNTHKGLNSNEVQSIFQTAKMIDSSVS